MENQSPEPYLRLYKWDFHNDLHGSQIHYHPFLTPKTPPFNKKQVAFSSKMGSGTRSKCPPLQLAYMVLSLTEVWFSP